MQQSLKKRTINGLIWSALQRFGALAISFIANLIIARILDATIFGTIGVLLVFVAISQSIVDSGFTAALIQRKDVTQVDYSTVFFWNLFVSGILVIVLYFSAPYIADYYNDAILCTVLRVQSVLLIVHALCVVQTAKLTKELAFKVLSIRNLVATFIGAIVAIVMAYYGYGIWSIVAQELVVGIVGTILLWAYCDWKPSFIFSWKSFKGMFKFGSLIFLSGMVETIYNNIQSLIIGRAFSMKELGYYTQAKKLESIPITTGSSVLSQVLFPAYSSIADDYNRIKRVVRKNISIVSFVAFPFMFFLTIYAEPIITILYTDKWAESIPMFQVLCIGGAFHPLNVANTMLFKSIGRGDIFFILQVVKRVLCIILILFSIRYGLYAMMWTMTITMVLFYSINIYFSHKYFGYTIKEQLSDIMGGILMAIFASVVVVYISHFSDFTNNVVNIAVGVLAYMVLYGIVLFILRKYNKIKLK